MTFQFVVKYLFPLIGISIISGGYFFIKNTQKFIANSIVTRGTIVGHYYSKNENGSTSYSAMIQFTTKDGTVIKFDSNMSRSSRPTVGAIKEVRYLEKTPEKTKVNQFLYIWAPPLFVIGVGSIFFLAGFITLIKSLLKS